MLPVTSADRLPGAPGTAQLEGTDGVATASGDGPVSPLLPFAHPTTHAAATTAIHIFPARITATHLLHTNAHTDIRPAVRWQLREGQGACRPTAGLCTSCSAVSAIG